MQAQTDGVQKVALLVRNPTSVKGILGIVKSWGVGTNRWGAESNPTNQNPN